MHPVEPIDPVTDPPPMELIFPDLEMQPEPFGVDFIGAFDQTCQQLDMQYLATFLFNEPYVAEMDVVPFLRGLEALICSARKDGARKMIPLTIRCGRCKPGRMGIGYCYPTDRNEGDIRFGFLFIGGDYLKEVVECRAPCTLENYPCRIPF